MGRGLKHLEAKKGRVGRQSHVEGRTLDLNPKIWHLHLLAEFNFFHL